MYGGMLRNLAFCGHPRHGAYNIKTIKNPVLAPESAKLD